MLKRYIFFIFSFFFLDVVESYKYLVKEKEALETSIKSLTDVEKINSEPQNENLSKVVNEDSNETVRNIACFDTSKFAFVVFLIFF